MKPKELLIRIYSFSLLVGDPPGDPTGNGGGFQFDCRGLPNPGREPALRQFTGRDPEIIDYFAQCQDQLEPFIANATAMVLQTASNYVERGFTDLQASFGCTGGRHRSVHCAERVAERLQQAGHDVRVCHWQMEREDPRFQKTRGLILGAGFGTRLQPMTNVMPKVLVPAGGRPMLDWCVDALSAAGCNEIVVNAHYFADQIEAWAATKNMERPAVKIIVSPEAEILGTGGGIQQAARWLHGPTPVLIHNGDIYTEINLQSLHDAFQPGVSVVLACQDRPASSHLLVDEADRVVGLHTPKLGERLVTEPIGGHRKLGFTGIHLASTEWLTSLPRFANFSIIESYLLAIAAGQVIRAVEVPGEWFEMGNPDRLKRLNEFLSSK